MPRVSTDPNNMTVELHADDGEEEFVPPICSIFRRFLKDNGLRMTAERARILDAVLAHSDDLFEVEQLTFEMRQGGQKVSKATVYRNIKHLVDAGIIREALLDSKQAHYQLVHGRKPKDHLVCVETDQVIEFFSPQLVELRQKICEEYGFDPIEHRLVIYARPRDSGS